MVFLGQASNYSARQTLRHLFSLNGRRRGEQKRQQLRQTLAEHYLPQVKPAEGNQNQEPLAFNCNSDPASRVQLYHTGRSALAAAFKALAPEGTNIIVPGLTCIAVVRAVRAAGCTPVFVDIDPKTLQYDFESLDKTINLCYNVSIIVAQNTLGLPLDMSKLQEIAQKHHIRIVEDLAHCAGRFYRDGREMGIVGDATVLSFGKGKAIDTIEGGAAILRTEGELAEPQHTPKLPDRLRDRWYPVFGAMMRGAAHVKLEKIMTGLLLKFHWITKSADAKLDIDEKLSGWQAGLVNRQLQQLFQNPPLGPLREFYLVDRRDEVLRKLRKAGYRLDEIWYDTPVSPVRYAKEANFPDSECPETVRLAKQIINLPTWYPPRKLDRARRIIEPYMIDSAPDAIECLGPLSSEELTSPKLQTAWRAMVEEHPEANFLQSPNWGETNRLVGHRIFLLQSSHSWCLAIVKNAKRGRYLELPGGPLTDWQDYQATQRLFSCLRDLARQEKCVFIRLRPQLNRTQHHEQLLFTLGTRPAPMHLHAEHTVMLDLTQSETDLLAAMRRQTRYEVRRQDKFGITVEHNNSQELFQEFHQVQLDTARRQGFVPPNLDMLMAERTAFGDQATIYLARSSEHEPIAYGLILVSGLEAEYFEAASTDLGRKLPGAYALQWQVIRDLKAQGIKRYNLWGIAPLGQKHHRYAGVTTFKTGFGGDIIEYLPAQDLVLRRGRYLLNLAIETLRKKIRHL